MTVGGNNLSTEVSGAIQDGGLFGGSGGSLVKTGTGALLQAFISGLQGACSARWVNVARVTAVSITVKTAMGRRFRNLAVIRTHITLQL